MTPQRLDNAPPQLVPIRLDIKLDGTAAHVHDTFCISLATPTLAIEQLASHLCTDAGIEPSTTNTDTITQAIQQQLDDARSTIAQHTPSPGVQLLRYPPLPKAAHSIHHTPHRLRVDLGDTVLQDTLEWDAGNNSNDVVAIARLLVQEHGLHADATAAVECAVREQVRLPSHDTSGRSH